MAEESALGGTSASTGQPAATGGSSATSTTSAPNTPAQSTSAAGGNSPSSWRDSLPEDIRSNPALASFTDTTNLAKSYLHAQSQIGKKGAIVPDWSKSTDEEKSSFYKAIGLPDPDKYSIKAPEGISPEILGGFKAEALKNGVLPHQAEALLNWYHGFDKATDQASEAEYKKTVQANLEGLKKEWGEGYDKEISAARMAVKEFGGDELIKYMNETGVGNDPAIIKAFAKAAKLFGEDKLREGGISDGRMTPQDIKDQIQVIQGSAEYRDGKHPGHAAAVTKMAGLYKSLTGGR